MIKCIFGVIKQKFQILLLAPEYDLDIQARLPAALCALHNFPREHDSEITALDDNGGHIDHEFHHRGGIHEMEGVGADDPEAVDMRDNIAHKMWVDYLSYLEDEESDNENFEDVEEGTEEG